uniref:Uncharacterized protein n=1 Tax=Meloidogyne incognita TaxID=6306 RepID=A0A914LH56_MELIC
ASTYKSVHAECFYFSNQFAFIGHCCLHFGLFCMDSLPRLRAECISWLFHYGVYTNWWGKFFVEVLNQHFASKMCQKNLDSAFIILSYLCSETVKYPRFQTNIIEQLVLSVLAGISTDNGVNISTLKQPTNVNFKILLSWVLMLISSDFDIIISKKRQNDRWLFLGSDFGPSNSGAADQFNARTCPILQRGYAIKKKYGTAKFAGPSSFVNVPNVAPFCISQSKMITFVKNRYKTLIDKLEKMKQSETFNYANSYSLPKVACFHSVVFAYSKMVQRAVDSNAIGQFLLGEDRNTSSISSNMFGIYSHYGNGQSFSVINAPAKNICFSNMDSENRFGITNDPLDFIGGLAIYSYEKMDGGFNSCWRVSTPPFSSTFSSSGIPITSSISKKKVTPKTTKSMAQKGIGSISNMPVNEEHLEIIDQNNLATSYFGMCPNAWITVELGSMPPTPPPHYGVTQKVLYFVIFLKYWLYFCL